MVDSIGEDDDLRKRRQKLLVQCQEYMSLVNNPITNQVGQMAGRPVKQIESIDSRESRIYQNYDFSVDEDRLLDNSINNIKKTESDPSNKILINPDSPTQIPVYFIKPVKKQ
jgi:hypothetical protein